MLLENKVFLMLHQSSLVMNDAVKKMVYNSSGFNTAEIIVESKQGTLSLFYHLNDNPVQHIWQRLHKDSIKFAMGVTHGKSLGELLAELNSLLVTTNRPTLTLPISQDQLNRLHNSFVEHSKNKSSADELQINLLIHAIESKNNFLTKYDSSTKFYKDPDNVKIPIKEEYKLWLMNENKWGHLLMGFGTLGKSWNEIAKTDDNLDDLNIQTTISSETNMIFNADHICLKTPENRFYKWAKNSKYNVPLNNLNQLSLGLYFLGEVIITDVFLDFHSTSSDWYVPNHMCRLSWNQNVLGHNTQVKQIKFFNSDMYYNCLLYTSPSPGD
jgi:hypothetical protein